MERVISTNSSLTLRVVNNTEVGIEERLKVTSFFTFFFFAFFYLGSVFQIEKSIGNQQLGYKGAKSELWKYDVGSTIVGITICDRHDHN